MIRIIDLSAKHTDEAMALALNAYERQRGHTPCLPAVDNVPDITPFANNGLGVAAFDGGCMVGFLSCYPPFKNAFRSTDATGVFSPMGAHAAVGGDRAKVYARMYQTAAEKWAAAGASSHAVCLYAGDTEAQMQFFRYGFGMRCVDAMRGMGDIVRPQCVGYDYMELDETRFSEAYPISLILDAHMAASPSFIKRKLDSMQEFLEDISDNQSRLFVALKNGTIIAAIKVSVGSGETFADKVSGTRHVNMGICLPEHRGTGVAAGLLGFAVDTLKADGVERFAVDFESINPTAWGFWLKHFDAYTYGVVRRIDEHAVRGVTVV